MTQGCFGGQSMATCTNLTVSTLVIMQERLLVDHLGDCVFISELFFAPLNEKKHQVLAVLRAVIYQNMCPQMEFF